jgi:ubiquinone/menaquinone biosynthesis C-methylase UbiE
MHAVIGGTMVDTQSNIDQSRQVFDQILHDAAYGQILADAAHLEGLIRLMDIREGQRYLDLATGNGYVAFELAQKFLHIQVTGLDITPNSIRQNRLRQQEMGLNHLNFQLFDGIHYPFENGKFFGIVSRYAFHHFPGPDTTLDEFRRILSPGGFVVISDPRTEDDDDSPFIDDFQRLRPDGHIHFYKTPEIVALFQCHGFIAENSFVSQITYPHKLTPEHTRLLDATPAATLQRYAVRVVEQQVFVTVRVTNIRFRLA